MEGVANACTCTVCRMTQYLDGKQTVLETRGKTGFTRAVLWYKPVTVEGYRLGVCTLFYLFLNAPNYKITVPLERLFF